MLYTDSYKSSKSVRVLVLEKKVLTGFLHVDKKVQYCSGLVETLTWIHVITPAIDLYLCLGEKGKNLKPFVGRIITSLGSAFVRPQS